MSFFVEGAVLVDCICDMNCKVLVLILAYMYFINNDEVHVARLEF